jgi:TolB protein
MRNIVNMKSIARLLSVCLLSLASFASQAQLVIEITKGQADAIPIAVVPFGWTSPSTLPTDVAEVVAADLARSGRFAPLDRRDMVDKPTTGLEIRFQDWKYLKSDYIAVGKVVPESGGNYTVQFELHNVLNGQSLIRKSISSPPASLRATAHRVADMIYEQLTGTPGAFLTQIAFLRVEGVAPKLQYNLIVADADGMNEQNIASSTEPLMSPAWSPDGKSLAYVSFEKRSAAIYVQTLRTGERRQVSARSGLNNSPAWSPDGRLIALTLSRKDGDVDVYTLDLNTQVLTRMTFDPGIDTEPVWSADGKKIYFTSDRGGSPQIYEVNVADPRTPRRVTFEGTYNARARLSPDGKRLAVVHLDGGNFRIATVDLASKAVQVLSQGRQDESPSFAPNGSTVIYATQDRGRGVLATVSVDGRVTQRLAASKGDVREPVWSPFPVK